MRGTIIISVLLILGIFTSCSTGEKMNAEKISSLILKDNEPNLFIGQTIEDVKQVLCNETNGFKLNDNIARKKYNGFDEDISYIFKIDGDKILYTRIEIMAESKENKNCVHSLYTEISEKLKSSTKYKFVNGNNETDIKVCNFKDKNDITLSVSVGDDNKFSMFTIDYGSY